MKKYQSAHLKLHSFCLSSHPPLLSYPHSTSAKKQKCQGRAAWNQTATSHTKLQPQACVVICESSGVTSSVSHAGTADSYTKAWRRTGQRSLVITDSLAHQTLDHCTAELLAGTLSVAWSHLFTAGLLQLQKYHNLERETSLAWRISDCFGTVARVRLCSQAPVPRKGKFQTWKRSLAVIHVKLSITLPPPKTWLHCFCCCEMPHKNQMWFYIAILFIHFPFSSLLLQQMFTSLYANYNPPPEAWSFCTPFCPLGCWLKQL